MRSSTVLLLVPVLVHAIDSYTGYSGAPGSLGTCASSCHGSSGGSITVFGFPSVYVPGSAYMVWVKHHGGYAISNFNASVREGTGSTTAGTMAAGLNTSVYSVSPEEPDGMHFVSSNQDSGSFIWTAPDPGVGDVRLYLAGMQGTSHTGPNTAIVLVAAEQTGVSEESAGTQAPIALRLENRIVTDYLILQARTRAEAESRLRVLNHLGRVVARIGLVRTNACQVILWEPVDRAGKRLAPGSYLAVLTAGGRRVIRKFLLVQ